MESKKDSCSVLINWYLVSAGSSPEQPYGPIIAIISAQKRQGVHSLLDICYYLRKKKQTNPLAATLMGMEWYLTEVLLSMLWWRMMVTFSQVLPSHSRVFCVFAHFCSPCLECWIAIVLHVVEIHVPHRIFPLPSFLTLLAYILIFFVVSVFI